MVDKFGEKVNECPLNRGRRVLLEYNWDHEKCPLYGVAGCPLFRGCLSIEVNGKIVGTFRIVRYIMSVRFSGVSVKWGSTVYREDMVCYMQSSQNGLPPTPNTLHLGCLYRLHPSNYFLFTWGVVRLDN